MAIKTIKPGKGGDGREAARELRHEAAILARVMSPVATDLPLFSLALILFLLCRLLS